MLSHSLAIVKYYFYENKIRIIILKFNMINYLKYFLSTFNLFFVFKNSLHNI